MDFGPTGEPAPRDDIVSNWFKREYDENGRRMFSWAMRGNRPGNSGQETSATLFSEMNRARRLTQYEYDISGDQTKTTVYISPGPDLDWMSFGNNEVFAYWEYDYDSGVLSQSREYQVSDNGTFLSEITYYGTNPLVP